MGTLHCALENGADLYVTERETIRTIALGLLKKKDRRMPNSFFYFSRCVYVLKLALYSDVIHSFHWKSAIEHDGGV